MTDSLNRPLKMTLFKNIYAKTKTDKTLSLNDFADRIEKTSGESKEDLPWFKLGRFGDHKTDKGSLRNNDNLQSIDGIEVDYDSGIITPKQALARLQDHDLAGIVYTSASHTPESNRFRVAVPCSTTLKKADRFKLVARLNGILDGDVDGVSFTDSQSYYFGKVHGKEKHFRVYRNEGRYIDKASDLDKTAKGKRQRDKVNEDGEISHELDETGSGAAWRKAKELIRDGGTIADFEEWAAENPWKDYEAQGSAAVERTWGRASVAVSRSQHDHVTAEDFDDYSDEDEDEAPEGEEKKPVSEDLELTAPTDETLDDVPPQEYLYSNYVARKWLGATVSPGGAGKSALAIAEGISMASGVDFLGPRINVDFDDQDDLIGAPEFPYKRFKQLRVGILNFEDDNETMRRRIAAVRQHHGIPYSMIKDTFFFMGAEQQMRFSFNEDRTLRFDKKTIKAIRRLVKKYKLDFLSFDPFVSIHHGDENSNSEMAEVWGKLRSLAIELNIAIHVYHHTRKGSRGEDLTADDARGGSAIRGAVRFLRVINKMQTETANKLGIDDAWRYIRVDDGKSNHAPPSEHANWRRLATVQGGEHKFGVVAVENWQYPEEEEADEPAAKAAKGPKPKESDADALRVWKALCEYAKTTGKKTFGKEDFRIVSRDVSGIDRDRRAYLKKRLLDLDYIETTSTGIFKIVEWPSDNEDLV